MPEPSASPYAHNLVSSLYAMKGMIETFLLNQEEGRLGDEREIRQKSQEVLKRAYHQADQALQMIKRLEQVFTREKQVVTENKKAKEKGSASLKEAWHEALSLLQKEFSFTGMETLERIPETFPRVQCLEEDLKEILYYLSRNAVQALEGKGKLILRAQVSFSTQEEPFAQVLIADTGPGIPEERLPHLFRPFFTTKSFPDGNGLGLYLTRHLVLRNQGRITASTAPGFGTTFTLEFPLAH